jgi:translation initiation factor 4G
MSHPQPVPPPPVLQQQPPATPSPAPPKDETSPFVRPKKSSAIRIVNPETKAEVTFTKVAPAVKVPERSPSPAVKSTPAKPVPRVTHSPAPSLDVERPASAQKSKEELKEEMKAKIASALVKEQAKKEEAERLDREKKVEEERKAKEESERVEKERKAKEERVAAQKAKEEEDARIAEERAREEAAAEAARLAKEKEEAETKAKEEAESKVREEAKAKAREEAEAAAAAAAAALTVSVEDMSLEERRPSLSGTRKTAPPPIAITSDTSIPDGLQSAALKTASFIKQDDFLTTKYPNGFTSPEPAINAKFSPKGFHYNVEFLAQFKDVYRDKPSSDWDSRIKETMGKIDNRQQRPGLGGAPRTVSASGGFPHQTMGTFGVGLNTKPGARPPSVLPSLATGGYNPINQPFPPRPPRQQSTSGQGMQS